MRKWKRFDSLPRRFLRAYNRNIAAADFSENRLQNGAMVFQYGGAFPRLRFRHAKMSGVCCEILAAYNALKLAGIAVDFPKLAAEFEFGAAIPAIPPGIFGSDPFCIGRCLAAYGAKFARYRNLGEFEGVLTTGKIGIVSYRLGKFDPRIHTFAVQKTEDGITAYNRYSNDRAPRRFGSVAEALLGKVFLVGYVLDGD
ncbi:MAG: hypothetical protein K2J80_05500 [Oscillospiraceae bacterium]|nr:hypothetical protein [Oscillospiraceae bacterium]